MHTGDVAHVVVGVLVDRELDVFARGLRVAGRLVIQPKIQIRVEHAVSVSFGRSEDILFRR